MTRALLADWISCFGCPQTIRTDQGRQFDSQLFHSLVNLCGIQISRKTAHNPAVNGFVKRSHRTLNAAIMFHADQHWTEALPLVLLGIRMEFKADLQASLAEIIYSEPLRIPDELLTPAADPVDPAHFITQLRQHMARLRAVLAARQASPATFLHSDLEKCTHVFLRQDTTRRAFEPPLQRLLPCAVTEREDTTTPRALRSVTVSTGRAKPAYMLNEVGRGTTTFNPAADATLTEAPPAVTPPPLARTTRSELHVCFPARFNGWATISEGVMLELSTLNQALGEQGGPRQIQRSLIHASLVTTYLWHASCQSQCRKYPLLRNGSVIRYSWK
jgi:hypothetical protein